MQIDWEYKGNTQQGVRVEEFKYNQASVVQICVQFSSWSPQNGCEIDAKSGRKLQFFPELVSWTSGYKKRILLSLLWTFRYLIPNSKVFWLQPLEIGHFPSFLPPSLPLSFFPFFLSLSSFLLLLLFFFILFYSPSFQAHLQTCSWGWSYQS